MLLLAAIPPISSNTPTHLSGKAPEALPGEYIFYAHHQATDNTKQTLVTGGFTGYLLWNGDTLESGDIRSGFIGAKDSLDQWQWIQKIEGEGYNQINAAMAYQGGWLIAGVFSDTIQPGGQILATDQYQGVFLARISSNGDYLGAKHIDVSPAGGRQFLSKGPGGDFFVGLEFNGACLLEDSLHTTDGAQAVLLSRINNVGQTINTKLIRSRSNIKLEAMLALPGGNLVTGFGYRDFITLDQDTLHSAGQADFLLVEWNDELMVTRMKVSQGTGEKRLAGLERHAGGILAYGDYRGEFMMDDEPLPLENGKHVFLMKFQPNGQLHWHHVLNGASHKTAGSLVVGDQEQIYLWSTYRGALHFMEETYYTEDFTHQWIMTRYQPNGQPHWIAQAHNLHNLRATIGKGNEPGLLKLYGFSPRAEQEVLGQGFDSLNLGMFTMNLMDCDFAQWPQTPSDTLLCEGQPLDGGEGFASYWWNDQPGTQYYYPRQSGWVTLELTNEYGCVHRDTVFVQLLPTPDIAIVGNDLICPENGHTVLTIDTQAAITWSTGDEGNILFVDEAGLYIATAIDTQGCIASDSLTVGHYDAQPPQLQEYYWISPGEDLTLYPGEYATYLWSNGHQGSTLHIDAYEYGEGTYPITLQVTDTDGCFFEHELVVEISYGSTYSGPVGSGDDQETTGTGSIYGEVISGDDLLSGIILPGENDELSSLTDCDFLLYPNPGQGPFFIRPFREGMIDADATIELMITGADGRFISKTNYTQIPQPWQWMPSESIPAGTYHLALVVEKKVCSVKNLVIVP